MPMRNCRGLSKFVWAAIVLWGLITLVVAFFAIEQGMRPDYEKKSGEANEAKDYEKRLLLFEESVALAEKANAKGAGIVNPLIGLGVAYQDTGDFANAIATYEKGLQISKADKDKFLIAMETMRLAHVQKDAYEQGVIEKQDPKYAQEYFAIDGEKVMPAGHAQINPYLAMAWYCVENKDYIKADEWIKKGIAHDKSLDWCFDRPKLETLVGLGKLREATDFYLKTMKDADNLNYRRDLASSFRAAAGEESGTYSKGTPKIFAKVAALLNKKDYDGLDRYAAELTASKHRDVSGHWDLQDFYLALHDILDDQADRRSQQQQKALEEWVTARPNSDVAKTALALFLETYAWRARGSSTADKVTDQGWKSFEERLQQAADVLSKIKKHDPCYYSAEQRLALGQGWERADYEKLCAEARAAYPDYNAVVVSKIYWLQPRWHGEDGDSEKALQLECDKLGGAAGDILYAQVLARVARRDIPLEFDEDLKVDWPRAKRGFAAMIARDPKALLPRVEMMAVAAQSGHEDDARKALDGLSQPVSPDS